MITGFAFREPGVIKLLLDRVRFAGFTIPEADPANKHVTAYRAALAEPVGKRTRVFLVTKCKTLCNLVSQIREFDHENSIYVVFDSASILYAKTCIDVFDADSSSQPQWVYSKTTPVVLNKRLADTKPGLVKADLECLGMLPENPEDRVETDKPKVREPRENFIPFKTLVLELLAEKSLNPNRAQAMHLLALWITGKFNKTSELKTGKRNITGIGIHVINSYPGKTGEYLMFDRMCESGLRYQLGFARHEARVLALKALPEFRVIAKALCLIASGTPQSKACSMTGVDTGTIAMIVSALQPPVVIKPLKWTRQEFAFPVHVLKRITAAKQTTEFVEEVSRAPVSRMNIPAGSYSLEKLMRTTRLIGVRDVWSQVKANTNSMPVTNIPKFKTSNGEQFRVVAGTRYFIRFRSTRIAVQGE